MYILLTTQRFGWFFSDRVQGAIWQLDLQEIGRKFDIRDGLQWVRFTELLLIRLGLPNPVWIMVKPFAGAIGCPNIIWV